MKEAEAALKGMASVIAGGFFSNLTSSKKDRMNEAVELYKSAAQQYKIAGASNLTV